MKEKINFYIIGNNFNGLFKNFLDNFSLKDEFKILFSPFSDSNFILSLRKYYDKEKFEKIPQGLYGFDCDNSMGGDLDKIKELASMVFSSKYSDEILILFVTKDKSKYSNLESIYKEKIESGNVVLFDFSNDISDLKLAHTNMVTVLIENPIFSKLIGEIIPHNYADITSFKLYTRNSHFKTFFHKEIFKEDKKKREKPYRNIEFISEVVEDNKSLIKEISDINNYKVLAKSCYLIDFDILRYSGFDSSHIIKSFFVKSLSNKSPYKVYFVGVPNGDFRTPKGEFNELIIDLGNFFKGENDIDGFDSSEKQEIIRKLELFSKEAMYKKGRRFLFLNTIYSKKVSEERYTTTNLAESVMLVFYNSFVAIFRLIKTTGRLHINYFNVPRNHRIFNYLYRKIISIDLEASEQARDTYLSHFKRVYKE